MVCVSLGKSSLIIRSIVEGGVFKDSWRPGGYLIDFARVNLIAVAGIAEQPE
jgi:hypothetical protein